MTDISRALVVGWWRGGGGSIPTKCHLTVSYLKTNTLALALATSARDPMWEHFTAKVVDSSTRCSEVNINLDHLLKSDFPT